MLAPVNYVGSFFYIGMTGRAAEEKIASVMETPWHRSSANPLSVNLREDTLQLEDLGAGYEGYPEALHQLNFSFRPVRRPRSSAPRAVAKRRYCEYYRASWRQAQELSTRVTKLSAPPPCGQHCGS